MSTDVRVTFTYWILTSHLTSGGVFFVKNSKLSSLLYMRFSEAMHVLVDSGTIPNGY